jgi:uncharacterized protein YbjT (DUF2867 family)
MIEAVENIVGKHKVAVFGASGYIGLILSELFANSSVESKLFVRNKRRLKYLAKQYENIKLCDTELEEKNISLLSDDLEGYDTVVYLIHSMDKEVKEFDQKDKQIATIVAKAASEAGVENIIYLSGLGIEKDDRPLSVHLKSRQDTASYLKSFNVPVTELRAGVIIGAGSASFEIIRNLATKMPFLLKLDSETGLCQPIDVDSVILYIIEAIKNENYRNHIIEIGSEDTFKYSQMVNIYANEIKKRKMPYFRFPYIDKLITKGLISWIVSLSTSLPMQLTRPLIGGIDSYAIIGENGVSKVDPNCPVKPLSYLEAIKIAADREQKGETISLWGIPIETQVYGKQETSYFKYDATEVNGLLYEERIMEIKEDEMEPIFEELKQVGGEHGYWSPQWLWEIRGLIDKLFGGPGIASGRRSKYNIREGERFDFWTVSRLRDKKDLKKLRIKARMKSPGNAWLEFTLVKKESQHYFILRAYYEPSGIFGYFYWYSLYFIHKYMFTRMINNIYEYATKK